LYSVNLSRKLTNTSILVAIPKYRPPHHTHSTLFIITATATHFFQQNFPKMKTLVLWRQWLARSSLFKSRQNHSSHIVSTSQPTNEHSNSGDATNIPGSHTKKHTRRVPGPVRLFKRSDTNSRQEGHNKCRGSLCHILSISAGLIVACLVFMMIHQLPFMEYGYALLPAGYNNHSTRTTQDATGLDTERVQLTCNVANVEAADVLPVMIPDRPEGCDVYDPECTASLPPDYYSSTSILLRSREYLLQHYPFLRSPSLGDKAATKIAAREHNARRLKKYFDRFLNCSSHIIITVLGGSLTAGRFVGGYDGAWPVRLQKLLQTYRDSLCGPVTPHKASHRVTVVNHAEPATTTGWALHHMDHLLSVLSDMVIVDYDVNDCALISGDAASFSEVQGVTELLIRSIMNHEKHSADTAVVFMNVAVNHRKRPLRGECYMYNTCYSMDNIRQPVLSAYSVPLVSSKSAVWANFSCPPPPDIWPCSTFCSHPLEAAHDMLANITADFIIAESQLRLTQQKRASRPPSLEDCTVAQTKPLLNAAKDMDDMLCKKPFSYMSVDLSSQLFSDHMRYNGSNYSTWGAGNIRLIHRDPCWMFAEDVVGKPGWIGTGCVDGSIIFQMGFGMIPALVVTALSTYADNTGVIEVSVKPLNNSNNPANSILNYDGFTSLGTTDLQREENDYKHYSIATPLLFNSQPASENYNRLFSQFYDQADNQLFRRLNMSNSYGLVRITQIDGNNRQYLSRMKQRNFEPRAEPQKVKFFTLQTC
jgi:hypothetical protein